jgi:hypothetical protein
MSSNAVDFKGRQFTATVVGTNHGDRVPANMVRSIFAVKYDNIGNMSNKITLYESNAAGTSSVVLDKQYLTPGETILFPESPNDNVPILTLISGNSYIRSIVEDSASGQVSVTTMERDAYA